MTAIQALKAPDNRAPIYKSDHTDNHIDHLYKLANLARVGVAASDTCLSIHHLQGALGALFEVMHDIADEAVEIAELAAKEANQ